MEYIEDKFMDYTENLLDDRYWENPDLGEADNRGDKDSKSHDPTLCHPGGRSFIRYIEILKEEKYQ